MPRSRTLPTTSFSAAVGTDNDGYTAPPEERICNTELDAGGTCQRIYSECPYHGPNAPDRTPHKHRDEE